MTQPTAGIPAATERTTIRNHPERAAPEEAVSILAQGLVAHVGIIEDGAPLVIPMSYHYDAGLPDRMYLHGSIRSRLLKSLAGGAPVCVSVTITDAVSYTHLTLPTKRIV